LFVVAAAVVIAFVSQYFAKIYHDIEQPIKLF